MQQLSDRLFVKIFIVSFTGIFVYKSVISNDANLWLGCNSTYLTLLMKWVLFTILWLFCNCNLSLIKRASAFAVLKPGAVVKFTSGLIGMLSLWILGNPVNNGAFAFMGFRYHRVFSLNKLIHLLIQLLDSLTYISVESDFNNITVKNNQHLDLVRFTTRVLSKPCLLYTSRCV